MRAIDHTALVAERSTASVPSCPAAWIEQPQELPPATEAIKGLLEARGSAASGADLVRVFARVIDAFEEGLAICDNGGHICYVNQYLCTLLGREAGELVGRPARAFFGEIYAPLLLGTGRHEAHLKTKGGDALVVEVSTQRLADESGRQIGSIALLTDVTARGNTEAALRRSESDLRLLSAQLWAAQEHERKRIARELHDGIGQSLGGIKFGLEHCAALVESAPAAALAHIEQLAGRMKQVVEEVRRISMGLRPSTLDDLGILATLGWFSREFRELYGEIELETLIAVREEEIAAPVKTAIYRIVQEATNNIVTHAQASSIRLSMTSEGQHVELRIEDDGVGFSPSPGGAAEAAGKGRGLGLTSMRERAEGTGGRFEVRSQPGRGTQILVRWPVQCRRTAYAASPRW